MTNYTVCKTHNGTEAFLRNNSLQTIKLSNVYGGKDIKIFILLEAAAIIWKHFRRTGGYTERYMFMCIKFSIYSPQNKATSLYLVEKGEYLQKH
jgi:hypothetical protein